MSCLLLSPRSRKPAAVWLGRASIIRCLSFRRGRAILAVLGGGRTMLGMAARSAFRCRCFRLLPRAGVVVISHQLPFFRHSVREVDVPLHLPAESSPILAANVSSLEAGRTTKDMGSRPGASLHPSTDFPDAELSRPENHESMHSLLVDVVEFPFFEMDRLSSPELAYPDEFMTGPLLPTTAHDGHPDGHSPSVQPPAETAFSDEAMAFFTIDTPYSCSAPEQIRKSPEAGTSRVDILPRVHH